MQTVSYFEGEIIAFKKCNYASERSSDYQIYRRENI